MRNTLCIVALALGLALVACTRSSNAKPSPNVTIEALTSVSAAPTIIPTATLPSVSPTPYSVGYSETADSKGFCHVPQFVGDGTIYFESKNVCILRGAASGNLRVWIQASNLADFNSRKAFAERKLIEFVQDGTLSSSELCDANARVGVFAEQADLGGAGDIKLTTNAASEIGCSK